MDSVARIKKAFFRPDIVGKYLDKKTFKILNMFGGKVRKTAQRSMRKKANDVHQKSGQGLPPFSHGKQELRKLLFYSLEREIKNVVVGPVKFERTGTKGIPRLMEIGGRIATTLRGKPITKEYKGNPYMIPAFEMYVGQVASWYRQAA